MKNEVYILSGARTPSGSFLGELSTVSAPHLGAAAIAGAVKKSGQDKESFDEVFMGHVVQAGCGQAPARQATLFAGLPQSLSAVTINKVCGSGLQSIIFGTQSIKTGDNDLVIAGGMENMSQTPHLLPGSKNGFKFGETKMKDSLQWDGLWDVYSDRAMGNCAEVCAKEYGFTREEQDAFAMESFRRAQKASTEGIFDAEIAPVTVKTRKGEVVVEKDESPFKANFEKIPKLRPAFEKDGTITAANASSINDGAAALVLGGEKFKDHARFKIVGYSKFAHDPTWFTTAPIESMRKVFEKTGLSAQDIDLFEINEAFSVVPLAAMKEFSIKSDKINIYGGGVSLGHPIGCSGARIVVTLMNALEKEQKKLGLASICIGGGEALSLVIERI